MHETTIQRIFIANRGEIARRIALTARRLGLETVAVYSGTKPPKYLADLVTEFHFDANESTALYLDQAMMIELAQKYRCDAIHPGFGFLSENAAFAQKVVDAGLIWIGPRPEAIDAMASKAKARELAHKSGVPCIEGRELSSAKQGSLDELSHIGFPLLVKAALGGGGKGMRIVTQPQELADAIQRASSEAQNSFGDPSLIVERFIETPRHIEVQVLGDKHGQVAIIGDRDCSLQRRHQKIIEEAPAPGLHAETRVALHDCARKLAQTVAYDSTGTVEFLLEESSDGQQRFFFLEMNTRLQVEHPVTEQVFDLDLVAWQIRVACGGKLSSELLSLPAAPEQHSIEARIYAEDPSQDFFPSPGAVYAFVPAQMPGVRWELGLDTIDEITSNFDPMIAKLVVTANHRSEALSLLQTALQQSSFSGPPSNVSFLIYICGREDFRQAPLSTNFLGRASQSIQAELTQRQDTAMQSSQMILDQVLANWDEHWNDSQRSLHQKLTSDAFNQSDVNISLTLGPKIKSKRFPGIISRTGRLNTGSADTRQSLPIALTMTDRVKIVSLSNEYGPIQQQWQLDLFNESDLAHGDVNQLLSPVPGKVIKIQAEAGQSVSQGMTLMILESMKMEFEIKSPRDATVERLDVQVGDQVQSDQRLVVFAED